MEAPVGVSSHEGVFDGGARKLFPSRHYHSQPSAPQQPRIGTVPQLLAGGLAGSFSKTCTAPLSRLTILLQVQGMHANAVVLSKASLWGEAMRIISEEGFRAFWKGNLVMLVHRIPHSAVNFYAFERYKSLIKSIPGPQHQRSASSEFFVRLVAGGLAGVTASWAAYPLDLVRTRLVAQRSIIYYQGIWHTLCTICRDEGVLALYKGLGPTLWSVGPNRAINFAAFETLKSYWKSCRPDDSTAMVSLACGGLSGIASSTATFPLDLVRRRMQLEGVAGQAHIYKTGLFGTLGHVMRTEGLRGLYRGILPEYYKVFPGAGITYMTLDILKELLSDMPSDR